MLRGISTTKGVIIAYMIKIVIADDEKWVRAIIRSIIVSWQNPDFVISGEASDGKEALELCTELSPNVLITDIRMPELEGLELIEALKQPLPNLKAIIISGYDDFNFAQSAIRLSAFDYLLKPIDEEELIRVLEKAKEKIVSERDIKKKEELLKAQHEAGFNLLREKFLNELIIPNTYCLEELKKKSKHLGIAFCNPVYCVIVVSIDSYVTKVRSMSRNQKFMLMTKIKLYFDRLSKRYFGGYSFFNQNEENEIIIICNSAMPLPDEFISSKLDCIHKIVKRHYNVTFSAGISTHCNGMNKLSCLYTEASKAVKYKMLNGAGSTLFYKSITGKAGNEIVLSNATVNEVVLNLKLLNENNVHLLLKIIFNQLESYKEATPQSIKTALWKFILDVVNNLNCETFNESMLYEFDEVSVYEELKKLEIMEDIKKLIDSLFDTILKNHVTGETHRTQNAVETAKSFLEKNYNKEITLELISNYVFLNPSYFSDLFKKETGQNFIEYLTGLRISKAKELLSSTNLKTYEVCEAVGYSDTKYFSKLFKRITGVNPSEYNKMHNKGNGS